MGNTNKIEGSNNIINSPDETSSNNKSSSWRGKCYSHLKTAANWAKEHKKALLIAVIIIGVAAGSFGIGAAVVAGTASALIPVSLIAAAAGNSYAGMFMLGYALSIKALLAKVVLAGSLAGVAGAAVSTAAGIKLHLVTKKEKAQAA